MVSQNLPLWFNFSWVHRTAEFIFRYILCTSKIFSKKSSKPLPDGYSAHTLGGGGELEIGPLAFRFSMDAVGIFPISEGPFDSDSLSCWGERSISYLIVLVNSSLYNLIRTWRLSPRRASLPLLFVALLLTTGLVWGNKVSSIEESTNIKVAAVQDESFDLERLEKLTQEAALVQPDIIVWPELSCPHFVLDEPRLYSRLSSLAKRSKAYLIIGSLDKVEEAESGSYYNTALLLSPKGTLVGKYHKVHPVQFTKGVVPGKEITCHDTRLGKIGIQICYDSDYNDVSRKLIREGAEMLFVPNLDPIRWGRVQHLQHSAMTLFRAVENRRWVLRAASSGVSQIIDPYGRVLHSLGIGDVGVLVGSIARRRDLSIFTRFGFAFPYLCQATVVALLAIVGAKRMM